MIRTWGAVAVAVVAATIGLRTASADTPQQQADKLFTEGRELVAKGDAKAACEKFEAAIKLDATATGTMLNLGLCYEKQNKWASALFWFRKAQAAAYEGKQAEYEAAAKDHTRDIAPKVPTLAIEVSGPPDAEVRIDGKRIDATEYGRVEVDPGSHEIVGRASGKKKVIQTIEVTDAQQKPVSIALTASAIPVYVDRGESRRRVAIVLGAVGVAAWGFDLWYGFHEKKQYEDKGDDKAKDRLRYIGTSVFVVGTAAVAAAAFLYFTAPGKEQVSDGTAFAPVITSDQIGMAYTGSF